MSVRFVIGRAGSGKTYHCLRAIREKLRESPIHGPRLLFLVPEQASQQMERAIHVPADPNEPLIAASHRAEVLSFQRLASRLLESAGPARLRTLPDSARVMVLRHLAAQYSSQLRYYQRVQSRKGFLDRLSATISELIQEGVGPEDLAGASTRLDSPNQSRRAAKLQDLHLLYAAYLDFLGNDLLDPSQNLQLARGCIDRCKWIHGAEIWVDGFASLSGEETATLLELARRAVRTEIAILLDPAFASARTEPPTRSIFAKTARTFTALNQLFHQAGVSVLDPLILDTQPAPRFRGNNEFAHLERSLFEPASHSHGDHVPPSEPKRLSLVELPTRRLEVDYAVSLLCKWARTDQPRYRYRDIAIVVRDLEPYYDLIRAKLDDCDIACFIDRRRPISHHPLAEFIRTATQLPVDGLTLELVRVLLKTGLLPVSADDADELENFLIAHAIEGRAAWSADDWQFRRMESPSDKTEERLAWESASLGRINGARKAILNALSPWLEFADRSGGHSGRQWADQLRLWLEQCHVPQALARWSTEARDMGDLDQSGEHEQVWTEVLKFLDSICIAFGDRPLSKEDFADIIDAGFSSLTLGLVPPTVDQVLVGSIERTRHPDIKAAILLGFNEGLFPARHEEDSILHDDDRDHLRSAGVTVGVSSQQRRHDESILAYIALTRASCECVVTYARADEHGDVLQPSPYLKDVLAACPGLRVTTVADPVSDRSLWNVQTRFELREGLTHEFRTRPPQSQDPSPQRAHWNRLYSLSREELAGDPVTQIVFSSLRPARPIRLSPQSQSRLFPGVFRTSVSSLETFATCPFKFFAERVLRLAERVEAPLAAVDVGKVHHAIMEEFAKTMIERKAGMGNLSNDELMATLRESCTRAADRLKTRNTLSSARDTYLLRRSAQRLARILHAQKRIATNAPHRIRAAELPFGFDPPRDGLPPLKIKTPTGRDVLLRGFIDRVDLVEVADELLGIVVDYKDTRNKQLEFSRAYHGLSLQLLAYLLVLAEQGQTLTGRPIRPAAALYISLGAQYQRVPHPDHPESRKTSQQGTFRPRGLLCAEHLEKLSVEIGDDGWAPHYSIYKKKNGELGYPDVNDAAPKPAFDSVLEHTRQRMGELADRILNGDVAVRPYRLGTFSPCSWCSMTVVCRFENGQCDVEYLPTLKRSEIYVRLQAPTVLPEKSS